MGTKEGVEDTVRDLNERKLLNTRLTFVIGYSMNKNLIDLRSESFLSGFVSFQF